MPQPKSETSRAIRQRDRFKCKACDSFGLKQRAHIIPDKMGGSVEVNNLLWMCEGCQRSYEPAHLSGFMYDLAVKNMIEFRDTPAIDSLVSGIFGELLINPEQPIAIEVGNVRLITSSIFSEPLECWQYSFLKFYKDRHHLHIEGRLKNENGFVILEFRDGILTFHTKDVWDIVRKPRMLRFESKTREVWFQIKQEGNGIVKVSGEVFAGGGKLKFLPDGITLPKKGQISDLTLINESGGIIGLSRCSPLPRPYGHSYPNVI